MTKDPGESARMRAEIDALTKRLAALEADAKVSTPTPQRARKAQLRSAKGLVALLAVIAVLAAFAGASVVYGQDAADVIDAIIINVKGNVGIGTADIPDEYRLDIAGNTLVEGNAHIKGNLVVDSPNPLALSVRGAFTPTGGVEFLQQDGTQGIGFGSDTIYATGSDTDQNLNLQAGGVGAINIRSDLRAEAIVASEIEVDTITVTTEIQVDTLNATDVQATSVNGTTVNGESPPLIFDIDDNVRADGTRTSKQDIGPLCADGDGCTIRFLVRGHDDKTLDQGLALAVDVYIEPKEGSTDALLGYSGTFYGYSDNVFHEFVLGLEDTYELYNWRDNVFVNNYSVDSDGTKDVLKDYRVEFSAPPTKLVKVVIRD